MEVHIYIVEWVIRRVLLWVKEVGDDGKVWGSDQEKEWRLEEGV
jgi:hypothetical protein